MSADPPKSAHRLRDTRETRLRLIDSALQLLAEQGVHGASMNQIVRHAGARNPSAVLYHFGSREGLLRAVLQHVAELLRPAQQEMIDELARLGDERVLTARDVIAAVHLPVLLLYFSDSAGMHAARLLSRCTWEFGEDGQKMLVEVFGPALRDLYEKLSPHMPEGDGEQMTIRFLLSLSSLFHAVTDMDVMAHLPVIEQGDARRLVADPGRLIEAYLDFQCYGLVGRPADPQ